MSDISAIKFYDQEYKIKDAEARTSLNNKVDKVEGKDLSTNDFSTYYKTKIDNVPSSFAPINAEENVINTIKVNGIAQDIVDKTVDLQIDNAEISQEDRNALIEKEDGLYVFNNIWVGTMDEYELVKNDIPDGTTIQITNDYIEKELSPEEIAQAVSEDII